MCYFKLEGFVLGILDCSIKLKIIVFKKRMIREWRYVVLKGSVKFEMKWWKHVFNINIVILIMFEPFSILIGSNQGPYRSGEIRKSWGIKKVYYFTKL